MIKKNHVKIGIVGVGFIAGYAHIPKLQKMEAVEITAICDIDPKQLAAIGDLYEIPASRRFTDYRELINSDAVDAVEICTPNDVHMEIAVAALKAGKPVNIEKPIAINAAQAEQIARAQQEASLPAMMCFSYRFMPAVRYCKDMLNKGVLGKILSVNVAYLKDSGFIPGRKLEWRFQKERAGGGVMTDLGSHLVDMTRLLVGEFREVCSISGIVIKERPLMDGSGMGVVDTDDYCLFIAKLAQDATASFTVSRCAPGFKNTIKFELYGTKGMIRFNLDDPNSLYMGGEALCPQQPEIHRVDVPARYSADQEETFVHAVLGMRDEYFPDINDGVACQRILDALMQSNQEKRWIALDQS